MGARRTTRSETCVGNAEGIAEEEWALKLGIFPGLVVVLIFFGVFDASVAQASSEASFARVLGAEACDFVGLQGPRNDVVFVLRHGPPFAIAARRRSTFSARARAAREEYLSCQLATRQLSAPHGRRKAAQTSRI